MLGISATDERLGYAAPVCRSIRTPVPNCAAAASSDVAMVPGGSPSVASAAAISSALATAAAPYPPSASLTIARRSGASVLKTAVSEGRSW